MIQYEDVLKEFKKYVEQFDTKNKEINKKISHSYHVADLANKLAKKMNLNEEDTFLIKTIGLLHDIGRFLQYKKTKKYDDVKTHIDHAKLAIEYLFQEKHIKDFQIPEKYYKIIEKAILNHNKLTIENGLEERELFFSKLIRDLDKIDLFRVSATNYDLAFKEKITPEVKGMFYHHTLVDVLYEKNASDEIVITLAFVYDIHFKESYLLLQETDNLELFLSVIEANKKLEEEFESLKKEVRTFLEERMEETC